MITRIDPARVRRMLFVAVFAVIVLPLVGGARTSSIAVADEAPATYQFSANNVESFTTLTSWQAKTRLSFACPVADEWVILAFAEYKGTRSLHSARVRMTVDGITQSQVVTRPVTAGDYMTFATVSTASLAAGSHALRIDYCTTAAGQTVWIRNARIIAIRKDALEISSTADDAARTLTATMSDCATLEWTPASPGDYLVMCSSEFTAEPLHSTTVRMTLNGAVYSSTETVSSDASDCHSCMSFATVACDAAPQTLSIAAAKKSGSTSIHVIRRCRLIAIRLTDGRFAATVVAGSDAPAATTSTSFVNMLARTWNADSGASWLLLTTFAISGTGTGHSTEAKVVVDGSAVSARPMRTPVRAGFYFRAGSADVQTLGTGPRVDISFRSTGPGYTAKIKNVMFVALPLD